jgi:serine/threonine protein kinase
VRRAALDETRSESLPEEGQLIAGKYRIERLIGKGAMGAVFAAHHEILRKSVALKVISEEQARTPQTVNRFLNEARAAAGIEGEHVARVLDVGQLDDGAPFMVLELLEGADLGQVLAERRPLPVPDVVDWALQGLEGLAEAHLLGIVHRDLKPANLFLARKRDGTSIVKVLDFGVSKHASSAGLSPSMTATSAILGSPLYMAPEQLRDAKSVDVRADVWAMGVVLYELLAGHLPFQADNVAELFVAVLEHAPPSLCAARADVPQALDDIVMRCLSRDVGARFQNVGELAAALEPFASTGTHPSVKHIGHMFQTARQWTRAESASRPSRRRSPRVVAVALAALGIGFAVTMRLLVAGHVGRPPLSVPQPLVPDAPSRVAH